MSDDLEREAQELVGKLLSEHAHPNIKAQFLERIRPALRAARAGGREEMREAAVAACREEKATCMRGASHYRDKNDVEHERCVYQAVAAQDCADAIAALPLDPPGGEGEKK